MAEQQLLDLLQQGVHCWNIWRNTHPSIQPNLADANLSGTDLSNVNLSGTNLIDANLFNTNLGDANLSHADLSRVSLSDANLGGANLSYADLSDADLCLANLNDANLNDANLSGANLSDADLIKADLRRTNIRSAYLNGADLNSSIVGWTTFGDVDLHLVNGLDTVEHYKPSYISTSTIERSQGNIPEAFLRGAGLSDMFIDYVRSLTKMPIEYHTCFISYSSKDQDFAERLYADLQSRGVRCWYAPHSMKIGDKVRSRIDESIHIYDKLLLVLSQNSIASTWVEHEVEMALAKERREKQTVLFPIQLDRTIMEMEQNGWPAEVRHTRHIGSFEQWKNPNDYQKGLNRLLRDLKQEVKKDK